MEIPVTILRSLAMIIASDSEQYRFFRFPFFPQQEHIAQSPFSVWEDCRRVRRRMGLFRRRDQLASLHQWG